MIFSLSKNKRVGTLLGTLLFCLLGVGQGFAAWDGSIATTAPGDTTIDGKVFYKITNEQELAWFAAQVNATTNSNANPKSNINAVLMADMDMSGHLWTPIAAGKGDTRFKGIFDGNGHKIIGLYIHGEELAAIHNNEYCNVPRNNKPAVPGCNAQNLGFVGSLDGTVRNLILEDVDIHATTNAGEILSSTDQQISVGAVVGWLTEAGGKVDNCIVSGTIKTTGNSQGVGGIVGNAKKGTISNCMSLVEIQTSGSKADIGGIIGITKVDVSVSSCVYAGPGLINTGSGGSVGGIAGNVLSGTMSANDSFFDGDGITYGGKPVSGVGKDCGAKCTVADSTVLNTTEINADSIACALNGIDTTTGACKTEPWSVGETSLSLNGYGADGYKIVFDANGGAFANGKADKNKFLAGGMAITADEIEKPTRENYSFAGWAKNRDAAAPAPDLGTVSKPDSVFAVWKPVYTITFNVAPGVFPESNESEKTKQVISGETITVEGLGTLPSSRCKNYVSGSEDECETWSYFTGWALTAGAHESDSVSLDTVTASDDLVLHAVWTDVETYTVTYNANQHGKTTVDYVRVGAGDTVSAPTDPIADVGYEFDGWFTDAEGENPYQFAAQIHESIILYAKWALDTFTVTYEMNGVSNAGENPVFYTIETPTFALAAPADSEGYVFEGWFYDANFTNPASQVIQGTTGDKTFYAKWSKKTYRVMYLADNNSYGSISDQFVEHGTTVTLESAGIFRRAGYEQNGWSTTMGGAKTNELGESVTVVAPVTLYPTWSWATYTITYVCDGCVNDPSNPTTYDYNTQKGIKFATAPEGYSFAGWFKEPDFQTQVTQIVKKSYGDITLYGKQLKLYTITYVGTDNAYGDKTYTSEKAAQLRGCAPREGYTFAGWYDNPDFEGDAVTEVPLGSSGDKTFYAKWVPISYTITYELNGGTNAEGNPESYTIEDLPIDLLDPVKTGYEFDGWYYNSDFSGDQVSGIYTLGSDVDVTLYAKWEKVYPFLVNDYGAVKVYEVENGDLTAEIDGEYTGEGVFSVEEEFGVSSVVLNRSFTAFVPVTLTLPFDIDLNNVENARFYTFGGVSVDENGKKSVEANRVKEGTLAANTPYMVIPTGTSILFKGSVTFRETVDPVTTVGTWQFCGTYSYKTVAAENVNSIYGIKGSADGEIPQGSFVKFMEGSWFVPMRAYLLNTEVSNRRLAKAYSTTSVNISRIEIVWNEGDEEIVEEQTTSVRKPIVSSKIVNMRSAYDLKGRQVNGKTKVKGAYYSKKVVK